ncbi:MAG: hypothetical protein HY794_17360 [Desulfarculus sp.]|nr:hypothetical protein [Desulfarculus sp.]
MTHHHDPEILRVERRAARHRALDRLLGLLLCGLGVLCLALVIPVWGGIRYLVYVGMQNSPELRLHMGLFMILAGVVLLGLAWYFYYRAPRLEDLRESYAKAEVARRQARQRPRAKVLRQGGGNNGGPATF